MESRVNQNSDESRCYVDDNHIIQVVFVSDSTVEAEKLLAQAKDIGSQMFASGEQVMACIDISKVKAASSSSSGDIKENFAMLKKVQKMAFISAGGWGYTVAKLLTSIENKIKIFPTRAEAEAWLLEK